MDFHAQPAFDSVQMRSASGVGPSMPTSHSLNQLTPINPINHQQYSSQAHWTNNATPTSTSAHHYPASMYQAPASASSNSTATINNLLNDTTSNTTHSTHSQHPQHSLPHPHSHQLPQIQAHAQVAQAAHAQAYEMMGFGRPPSMSPTTFTDSAYSSSASPSSPTYTLASPASPLGLPHHFGLGGSSGPNSARGSMSAPRQTPGGRSFSHDSTNMMHPSALAAAAQQHQQQHQTASNVHSAGLYQFDHGASNAFTPRTQTSYNSAQTGPHSAHGPPDYGLLDPNAGAPSNNLSAVTSASMQHASAAASTAGMMQPLRQQPQQQTQQQQQQQPSSPVEPNHQRSLRELMGQFSSKKRSGPQRKHQCRICQHAFTRPSSVDIHIRSHTGEKPFGCSVEGCDRYFSVLSNARRHERTHMKKEAAKAGLTRYDSM
ncbi:C2H2 conidiation transcription factor [Ceratocystis lukuohia]|uniref:C2H2 type master regulator of conidiophore development brlA n=1 Tax=Ceratocystis lukuohia TaxID=2019550 RepID=A0ABR4MAY1_9PEZI